MKPPTVYSSLLKALFSSLALACCVVAKPALAQTVSADGSLSTVVNLSADGKTFTITAGDHTGQNLFHSFSEFSIPSDSTAAFENALSIDNIISRVTGESASTIDGLLQARGTANLFLLNPSGIIFGEGVQLSLGGSFIGSTAESLQFADGTEFVATAPTPSPSLTISAPVGLQLGPASQDIQNSGTGYSLTRALSFALVADSDAALSVKPGNVLALVGRNLTFEDARVSAQAGQIELGSVASGQVRFDGSAADWNFDYGAVDRFGDMQFSNSLVDAIGIGGGFIHLQGRNITLDNSIVVVQNQARLIPSVGIVVDAAESLTGSGADPGRLVGSGLTVESLFGTSGDISISARTIAFAGGSGIESRSIFAPGGDIIVDSAESILLEPSVTRPLDLSGITTSTLGPSKAGNILIETDVLSVVDGSNVSSLSFGAGDSGNVAIENAVSVTVSGTETISQIPSLIGSTTLSSGNAGSLQIDTQRLAVLNGARVDSSTAADGNAGTVVITASESINVSGFAQGSINPSAIISSANVLDERLRIGLGLPDAPTGNSGDIVIMTPVLRVSDGAQVTVKNDGTGIGGILRVAADAVYLEDRASLTASTQSGSGGNIYLSATEPILLKNGSTLSAEAGGTGDGGNITISAPFLIAVDNSDIVANAFEGNGGSIKISAQRILGTAFRDEQTPESDITVSSEFGVSGVVDINNLETASDSSAVVLPNNVVDPSVQVAAGCAETQSNQFVASGRGGLPSSPTGEIAFGRLWRDTRELFAPMTTSADSSSAALHALATPRSDAFSDDLETSLIEATAWVRDAHGKVALTTASSDTAPSMLLVVAQRCLGRSALQAS